jgi:hypothetical protein
MLSSIDLIGDEGSKILIGIDNEEAAKAHGHILARMGMDFLSDRFLV